MEREGTFDSLLELEDNFYQEGYKLGVEDGSRAGRVEGRLLGLEKGFEKYVTMGQYHGNVSVWQARVSSDIPLQFENKIKQEHLLPPLSSNPRLEKHLQTLYALVEPASLPTQNTEEGVSEVDDRLKRAGAKAKVIETIIDGNKHSEQLPADVISKTSSDKQKLDSSDKNKMSKPIGNATKIDEF
ncbi:MAG: hypothetical protein M1820_004852 [Bogoriella megaspora]|nr:MAG: hypothetical protein M1820_004852 [Bogoriella megaspora]